ncbi:type 1 glutamine amidotransferase [Saxibacter everestensis]|uniref:Type 1 glutamine amidotransferase n=1 Tax=Saxibacter everestensis TaxID=2909229 RepID=A0ABY8QQQ4_9MICO|nr:type 1 glutamine amidotransferase [Brevibacteriaceae bacterium ZFBP1038]
MPEPEAGAPRILVVQNSAGSALRRFGEWWAEDGLAVDIVRAFDGDAIPDLGGYHALVLLGGGLMPDEDDRAPWLPREREVTREALQAGLPLLGLCLGGQLMAHVAGGKVQAKHGLPENGSTELTRLPEAENDALFGPLPRSFQAIEHRVDSITELPPDAVWLASSERCPIQAFRLGNAAWACQFHPEVGADRVQAWDREELAEQGFDPDDIVRKAVAAEPVSEPQWRAFAQRFADLVKSSAAIRQ